MTDQTHRQEWVDRYLKDQLSPEDEETFETRLLESQDLQDELEAALALRAVLARESDQGEAETIQAPPRPFERLAGWQPMALAATVALAILSTVMWWKTGNDAAALQQQLATLAQPRSDVLIVAVPIMRSSGGQTPDVIVQKPQGRAAILLDIELGLAAREEESLAFSLVNPEGETVLAWQSAPTPAGRATAVVPSEQIPASRLSLEIGDANGKTLETRLLEFRK